MRNATPASRGPSKKSSAKGILYDATLCVGCLECEGACAKQNGLPYDEDLAKVKKQSELKYTFVSVLEDEKYMRTLCMHCQDPTCVSVCPVGALEKTALGPVTYDAGKCMGCRYCMVACPFNVPKYEWSKVIPVIKKCTMCSDRLLAGQPTACSEACPTGATITGNRDELLQEASRRIRENPGQYVDHIYGENEVGGTSILMLSSVPFEQFGMKAFSSEALPPL
ncbi:MAG TPA: 4Fe-4S dicluster domain-containing protein, partial [Thermoanaerobaculia bacterium]|nr:4Fe-4S dicluster domain-containing protein [Thermoanaerobaculia bacterium]